MNSAHWQSSLLASLPYLRHAVTHRTGGVSSAPYHSLNLGLHVGDASEAVRENRAIAARSLGFSPEVIVCAEQIHGGAVCRVGDAERGRGALEFADAIPAIDALITNTPDVLLLLCFADCYPVFLVDPAHRAVGIVHAGWRGVVANVVEETVAAMGREFGSDARQLIAAIGPGIGACCFAVGEEVARQFPADARICREGQWFVDLPQALRGRLEAAGIASANTDVCGECTSCRGDRYFSHRRDAGRTGRMGAMIGMVGELTKP